MNTFTSVDQILDKATVPKLSAPEWCEIIWSTIIDCEKRLCYLCDFVKLADVVKELEIDFLGVGLKSTLRIDARLLDEGFFERKVRLIWLTRDVYINESPKFLFLTQRGNLCELFIDPNIHQSPRIFHFNFVGKEELLRDLNILNQEKVKELGVQLISSLLSAFNETIRKKEEWLDGLREAGFSLDTLLNRLSRSSS